MSRIINLLTELGGASVYEAASSVDEIEEAEKMLGLQFAVEYKKYVSFCGTFRTRNMRLTGMTECASRNVVYATALAKTTNVVPPNFYLIEQIDGNCFIWQNSAGTIFETRPGGQPLKIYDRLSEYIISRNSDLLNHRYPIVKKTQK